jgi:hypothetical protein
MKRIKLRDSLLQSVGYDVINQTLEVECMNSGGIYWFSEVPDDEYYALMGADNHREYFEEYIEQIYHRSLADIF